MKEQAFTAFPSTEKNLKTLIRTVDLRCFTQQHTPACSFLSRQCFGMCCSLAVAVTQEEAHVLTDLVKNKKRALKEMGIRVRLPVVTIDQKNQRKCLAKRMRSFSQLNKIIHRLRTKQKTPSTVDFKRFMSFLYTCVFTLEDGSCALQRLSVEEGKHKWYHKPFNCWKYPLSIDKGYLTLPANLKNLPFPCSDDRSIPAYQGLKEELLFLGTMIGRDINAEIKRNNVRLNVSAPDRLP